MSVVPPTPCCRPPSVNHTQHHPPPPTTTHHHPSQPCIPDLRLIAARATTLPCPSLPSLPARCCPPALPCRAAIQHLDSASCLCALHCARLTLAHARLVPLETSHSLICILLNISPPPPLLALCSPPTHDPHCSPSPCPKTPASCSLSQSLRCRQTSAVAPTVPPPTLRLLPLVPEPARLKFQQRPASAPPFHHK